MAWPLPFQRGSGSFLKIGPLDSDEEVIIFTVSGFRVRRLEAANGVAVWDGLNEENSLVAAGVYFYVVKNSQGHIRYQGKLLVTP